MDDTNEIARATSERGELVLRRSDGILELRVNGVFVMDTAETGSEIELARAALATVDHAADVMVGGLGLGFTAHEVLADSRVERLVVVEIEEMLVRWMRDGIIPHGPSFLADERLTLKVADIRVAVAETSDASFDLVLLDVDNGPDYLVYEENAAVYQPESLQELCRVLRPGGAVVVWSAAEAPRLQGSMAEVFGNCEAVPHPVKLQTREERYWLYLSRAA